MPTSVRLLFETVGLQPSGPVRYGRPVAEDRPGVYVVSQTDDLDLAGRVFEAHISLTAVEAWIARVPNMRLDGGATQPARGEVRDRLRACWLPDEPVLYIGQTGDSLSERIRQLYRHRLGEAKPHRGGHWLKTLGNLDDMFIFWAVVTDGRIPEVVERGMVEGFVRGVAKTVREKLHDPHHAFPWANLEHPKGVRKDHGLRPQAI